MHTNRQHKIMRLRYMETKKKPTSKLVKIYTRTIPTHGNMVCVHKIIVKQNNSLIPFIRIVLGSSRFT